MDGQGSTLLDAEGVPTRRIDFVEEGVLKSFAYDLKTAYRYGEVSTGSAKRGGAGGLPSIGMHNLHVDGERSNIFDEKALYVHDVVGAHTANTITGDFSLELSNTSWMESGEYGDAVRSAMVSGNFFEMMKDIAGLSESSREVGSSKLPSVRFNSIRIIGK
jgi:PmbA protein